MSQRTKTILGHLAFASRLNGVLLGQTGVVVAFHHVSDARDERGLSIDPAMFERYCRFFRRHFQVIPLRDFVANLERRAPLDRQLAITFDDGYRNNFDYAAPVLEKLGLPATFFVVSQWIGSDVVPWWDREQNMRHPWMTWDQVRSLRRRGFDIGAHTRTHVDLGFSDNVQLVRSRFPWHVARENLAAHFFSVATRFAPGTGCFRDSTNAVMLASSSGLSDLPKAGMLTPPFTIRITMSLCVRRSPTYVRSGPRFRRGPANVIYLSG